MEVVENVKIGCAKVHWATYILSIKKNNEKTTVNNDLFLKKKFCCLLYLSL